MFSFSLPLLSLLFLFSTITTTVQPYKAAEHFLLDCGSSTSSDQNWEGDDGSEFVPLNITTTSMSSSNNYLDPSVPLIPYSTARIFKALPFTYTFPVSNGPKFIRLYFYPANLNANQSFFSVSSNGYSLLTNFSPFLTALYLAKTRGPSVPSFVKEFIINVKHTKFLTVTFTPSPNSYAFVNGIEIVSMPGHLYFNAIKEPKPVGMNTGPIILNDTALENIYRLNMGGGQISDKDDDTGMYRSWDQDISYIYGGAYGVTPFYQAPITYTSKTPNYTAPAQVYQTQRSMGKGANRYNLTWILPVDSGFYYMLRLHFCNIIPQYTKRGQVVFDIFISNQTAEKEADLFYWTQGSGYPFFKDYVVFVNEPDSRRSKQDLWLAMHPDPISVEYDDAYLNGLEVFKLSSMDRNLSSPNPEVTPAHPLPNPVSSVIGSKKTPPYAMIIGGAGGGVADKKLILKMISKTQPTSPYYQ